jgi:hypothetical protein
MDERGRETSRIGSSLGSPGSSPANGEAAPSLDQAADLDHAIDVVAREMTAVDASAGMRAAVLVRIEGERERSAGWLPRWVWAAGVAVVVLAVAATVWFGRPGDRSESAAARHDTSSMPAAGAPQSQQPASGVLASAGLATDTRTGTQPAGDAGLAARDAAAAEPDPNATATPEMGPPPLAQSAPIVLVALGPDAIHIPDISIDPLGDLKPITIQDIPVGSGEPQSPPIQKVGDQPVPPVRSAERAS